MTLQTRLEEALAARADAYASEADPAEPFEVSGEARVVPLVPLAGRRPKRRTGVWASAALVAAAVVAVGAVGLHGVGGTGPAAGGHPDSDPVFGLHQGETMKITAKGKGFVITVTYTPSSSRAARTSGKADLTVVEARASTVPSERECYPTDDLGPLVWVQGGAYGEPPCDYRFSMTYDVVGPSLVSGGSAARTKGAAVDVPKAGAASATSGVVYDAGTDSTCRSAKGCHVTSAARANTAGTDPLYSQRASRLPRTMADIRQTFCPPKPTAESCLWGVSGQILLAPMDLAGAVAHALETGGDYTVRRNVDNGAGQKGVEVSSGSSALILSAEGRVIGAAYRNGKHSDRMPITYQVVREGH
jgi:hypothetical protein